MARMKSWVLLVLVSILITGLFVGCGKKEAADQTTASALEAIKAKGKLVIGVKGDFPPYGFVDEKGNNVGFEIDMARRLAEDLFGDPEKIELVVVTGTNRIPNLQSGKIDVILATLGITEERATQVDYSKPYFKSGVQLLVPKDSTIDSLEDLKGQQVITITGTTGDAGLQKLVPEAKLLKLATTSEALQALRDNRGVAFAQDNTLIYVLAKQYPEFKVVGEPFAESEWALAARKGETDVVDWINKNLDTWLQEDYYYQLYEKWIAKDTPDNFDPSVWIKRP
ncbi:MAG: glutamine ABC transporter substrate-binding protein [Firmicutes bacterium HGW-Firmicutes-14]|nr:MAG: glutamine ABC transporter substrate-binding protein [Firmicutes bacterium HGW-Firmicutes-14]